VLFLLSVICFLAATQIRTESTKTNITKTNLFSHELLFEYEDVEKIEIKLTYEDMNPKIAFDYSFTPLITITANNTVYELDANGFGYDYLKIEEFLSSFDSDKITVDSTHSEDVILAAEEQQAAFERIFIN
ncbi:MAG: hypothetical protein IKC01_08715, partial [Clostridia bacterium]|nr:hypothetical protein [Clostridia bacterium]